MKINVMMGSVPAAIYAAKLQDGGVDAAIGSPLVVADGVVQGLPAQADGVAYLIASTPADAMTGAGRTDLFRLPPDASSSAPQAFGLDCLIQVV